MAVLRVLGRILNRVLVVLGARRMTSDGQNPDNGNPLGFEKPPEYRP